MIQKELSSNNLLVVALVTLKIQHVRGMFLCVASFLLILIITCEEL